ncbi:MAG: thioredoxin domain-containing protein [Epsilonproteobacteria bacterium]|nr:thioredoxin domain-containing protein [Campylobacterota bacterium]
MNLQASEYKYTNELINEDSPYLRQHAHNPVNWFAWGDKAFTKAKKENKLIFISIGYSTCHWCHVMERETFEDVNSAKVLNDSYVSIKVDREERPDIDKYYQDVYYLLNKRGGGWPLSIVMTPNKEVIFAATYMPAHPNGGMSSFKDIMSFIAKKFKDNPKEIDKSAKSITKAINQYTSVKVTSESINMSVVDEFVNSVKESFDEINKGIGQAPKFPHASTFDTLLDVYRVTKNQDALFMSEDALEAMANGGINDQIEGGFFRYSTDENWIIPHFEKMLYTNAELIEAYSKLYAIKPTQFTKDVVNKTIENMDARFFDGSLYKSASDADGEGDEGKYFVFNFDKAKKSLQNAGFEDKNAQEILKYLNITKRGNFEHETSNPYVDKDKIPSNLDKAKKVLKNLRSEVKYPFIDDKLLTSWNSLMASALFEAGNIDEKYPRKALALVDSILQKLQKHDILYHQLLLGKDLKVKAMLEDYAFFIDSLIKSFTYTQDKRYLNKALSLANEAMRKFYIKDTWYLSDSDFKSAAPLEDASYKSAKVSIIKDLFTLSLLSGDIKLYEKAQFMLSNNAKKIKNYPSAYPSAIELVMIAKKTQIDLKAPKNRLSAIRKIKKEINYPYLYILEGDTDLLQACSDKQCFAFSKDADELKKDIIKYLKQN